MTDIGSTLQEARMRARIDISEVEATTKIRAKYLRAIENEEWDMLPGPTFVKSFLRTYADYLGIDGRLLVEEYKQRHEPLPDQAELQAIGPPREQRLRPAHRQRDAHSRQRHSDLQVQALQAHGGQLLAHHDGERQALRRAAQPHRHHLRRHPDRPAPPDQRQRLLMAARAGIVVTGTEVLSGRVTDRNGPWLS